MVMLTCLAVFDFLFWRRAIMVQVDVLEAKADLSRLVHLVKTSRKDEIVVTRNGSL
jgi:hypothetical protein